MAIKIATLFAEVTARTRDFDQNIDRVEGKARTLQSRFGGLAKTAAATGAAITAIGTTFILAANRAAEYADEIDKMSIRTGFSAERLQELKFITSQTGVSFEAVGKGIEQLTRRMPEFREGTSRVAKEFGKLNVEVEDNKGELRSAVDIFDDTVLALSRMENQTERDAIALNIFGRQGKELTPIIAQGAEGIEMLSKRAHELGLVMSNEGIKGLVLYKDKVDELKRAFEAGLNQAVAENIDLINDDLIPLLQQGIPVAASFAINAFGDLAKDIRAFSAQIEALKRGTFADLKVALAIETDFQGFKDLQSAVSKVGATVTNEAIAQALSTGLDFGAITDLVLAGAFGGTPATQQTGEQNEPNVAGGPPVPPIRARVPKPPELEFEELLGNIPAGGPQRIAANRPQTSEELNATTQEYANNLALLSTNTFQAGQALRTTAEVSDVANAAIAGVSEASVAAAQFTSSLSEEIGPLITGFGYAASQAIRLGEGFGEALEQLAAQTAGSLFGRFLKLTPLAAFAEPIGAATGQIFGAVLAGPREERELTARVGVDALYFTSSQRNRFINQ